jgi:hypothetical protein
MGVWIAGSLSRPAGTLRVGPTGPTAYYADTLGELAPVD